MEVDFHGAPQAQANCALYEVDGSGSKATLFQKINGDDGNRYVLRRS
jgi:hypothetical protein